MKITHNKVGQNLNVKDTGKSEKAEGSEKAGKGKQANILDVAGENSASKVSVSSRAQDMKKAKEIAKDAPDVDEAKVERLQKLIDSGKYKVDAKDIADKMVDEELAWS